MNRDTLIEEVARSIWTATEPESNRQARENGGPEGYTWDWLVATIPDYAERHRAEARAAVDLVLDRVKTEIEGLKRDGSIGALHRAHNRTLDSALDSLAPVTENKK